MIGDPCPASDCGRAAWICGGFFLYFFASSLMDLETELGFYTVPFILICFRLPRLTITASLWQTNAPSAKISSLALAIAQTLLRPDIRALFYFFPLSEIFQSEQAEQELKGTDCASHTVIHQTFTQRQRRHCCCCFNKKSQRGGNFPAVDSQCRYIKHFNTLSPRSPAYFRQNRQEIMIKH